MVNANLVLIGFMGSGKSTLARVLAKRLNVKAIEMDELIVKKAGKSIPAIFKDDGEIRFREHEIAVAKDLSALREPAVISTGGGVVMNKIIIDYLKSRRATVIFLDTSFETIICRIKDIGSRPLFANKDSAKELYQNREFLYRLYADIEIQTDNKSIDQVAQEIQERI